MPFRLADAIFWVAVACCCVAQVAIVRSVVISPTSAGGGLVSRPRRASEITWAIIPGLVLAIVLLFTWRAMHGASDAALSPTASAARVVRA